MLTNLNFRKHKKSNLIKKEGVKVMSFRNQFRIIVIGLMVFGITQNSYSQNFVSLLNKLDKVDERVNQIEQSQKNDITKLQKDITDLKKSFSNTEPGPKVSELYSSLTSLESRVNELDGDFKKIKNSSPEPGDTESITELAKELRELINELRSKTAETPATSEVTKEDGAPQAVEEVLAGLEIPKDCQEPAGLFHKDQPWEDQYMFFHSELPLRNPEVQRAFGYHHNLITLPAL